MKFKLRDTLIIAGLIAVGICASILHRAYFTRDIDEPETTIMPAETFVELCEQPGKRAYFYIYDKHRLKYQNLLNEDSVGRIYIVDGNECTLYRGSHAKITLDTFSHMNNAQIVEAVEKDSLGLDLVRDKERYTFSVKKDGDGVAIAIENASGYNRSYTFVKQIPQKEIVQDVFVSGTPYCGYLHQSSSVDRFLRFQVEALVTVE